MTSIAPLRVAGARRHPPKRRRYWLFLTRIFLIKNDQHLGHARSMAEETTLKTSLCWSFLTLKI